jgi:Bacterial TSP3 repeat
VNYVTKKNIVLIIIAALFVTGVFFITEYRNKNAQKALYSAQDASILATSSSAEEVVANETDSDGDGLHDWEEVLWGTDAHNPDTDGDGTSDGVEINAGRNPLMKKTKTVDDSFNALAKIAAKSASSSEELTLTDTFGRDVFSKYMVLRQSGQIDDKTQQQQLINDILLNQQYAVTPKVYTDAELVLNPDTDAAAAQHYADQLSAAFKQNLIPSRNEGIIVKDSLDKGDSAVLKELDPIIVSYKALEKALIAIPAPKLIFANHKNVVNSVSELIFVDESLKKTDVDPIVSLQGLGRIQTASQALYDSVQAIKNYLTTVGVTLNLQ